MKPGYETASFHNSCRPAVATLYLLRSPVKQWEIAAVITVEYNLLTNLIKINYIEGTEQFNFVKCLPILLLSLA